MNRQSSANLWDTVVIIGVGLIGASVGMALRKLMNNRTRILKSMDKFAKLLAESRESLAAGNETDLVRILDAGKRNRDSVGS